MSLLSCCPSFDSSDGGKKRNRGVGGCNLAGGHSRNEAIKRRSRRDRNVLLPPRQSWAAIFWGLERNDAHHKSFYSVHHQKVHNRDGRHVLRPPFCFHWLNPFFPPKLSIKVDFLEGKEIFSKGLCHENASHPQLKNFDRHLTHIPDANQSTLSDHVKI